MSAINASLIDEIQKRSIEQCIDLTTQLVDSQLGVGDQNVNREERMARFVDYAQRGVLDALKGIGAPVYNTLVHEYVDDMKHSPYVTIPAKVQPHIQLEQ
jgi:hypothetical protein